MLTQQDLSESVGKSATVEMLAPCNRNASNSRDRTGAACLTARILVIIVWRISAKTIGT
jgi:hypothetical protein